VLFQSDLRSSDGVTVLYRDPLGPSEADWAKTLLSTPILSSSCGVRVKEPSVMPVASPGALPPPATVALPMPVMPP